MCHGRYRIPVILESVPSLAVQPAHVDATASPQKVLHQIDVIHGHVCTRVCSLCFSCMLGVWARNESVWNIFEKLYFFDGYITRQVHIKGIVNSQSYSWTDFLLYLYTDHVVCSSEHFYFHHQRCIC